jgi:DNA-directed RNA polymerase specialized sigma24 family protein
MANAQLATMLRHIRGQATLTPGSHQSDGVLLRSFVERDDQAAFTAIVKRHGPLVLGFCRRVLHNLHDAEDAFQATFILLARNALAIRREESLAGWLYGIAYRMAEKAKRAAALASRRKRSRWRGSEPAAAGNTFSATCRPSDS